MSRSIGQILPQVLAEATERHQRLLWLQRRWTRIVGKELTRHTKIVAFRRGTLYVQTDEPGSSYLLHLDTPQLLRRLNVGRRQQRVEELVIRAGGV